MVVWLKPCKSRSLPGAFTETLQLTELGGFFFFGAVIGSAAEPTWIRGWPLLDLRGLRAAALSPVESRLRPAVRRPTSVR